jgi:hypothetical protein
MGFPMEVSIKQNGINTLLKITSSKPVKMIDK